MLDKKLHLSKSEIKIDNVKNIFQKFFHAMKVTDCQEWLNSTEIRLSRSCFSTTRHVTFLIIDLHIPSYITSGNKIKIIVVEASYDFHGKLTTF